MLIPKPPCSFFCVETVVWPRNTAEGPELQESVMLQPCCMVLWLFFCFCMFQSSLCCWEWKVREETPWGYARPPKFVFFVVWVRMGLVNQLSLLGVVGVNWIFPFVMWNNSVFWAWLECIQSFLLWREPIQSFGMVERNAVFPFATWTNSVFWAWLVWIQSFGMVERNAVFPFAMWTNSAFWAWLVWIQSFLL